MRGIRSGLAKEMNSSWGSLQAGEEVAVGGAGVDADLVGQHQGLPEGGVAEDHLAPKSSMEAMKSPLIHSRSSSPCSARGTPGLKPAVDEDDSPGFHNRGAIPR